MSNETTTTQKIRLDLSERLRQAEQKQAQPLTIEESIDNAWLIEWIRRKLAFYSGPHREHGKNNADVYQPVQFERQPDEGLL